MDERDVSTVGERYQQGLELARSGAFFEAHEEFELAWRNCDAFERDFFQGLVHVVVSAYQRGRGRPVAAESSLLETPRLSNRNSSTSRAVSRRVDGRLTWAQTLLWHSKQMAFIKSFPKGSLARRVRRR